MPVDAAVPKLPRPRAQLRSLELQRADVDKLVELDVRQAHARANEAVARIRKDKAARALGEEGLQLAELRFQQGAGIQADTLDAELALSTAETAWFSRCAAAPPHWPDLTRQWVARPLALKARSAPSRPRWRSQRSSWPWTVGNGH